MDRTPEWIELEMYWLSRTTDTIPHPYLLEELPDDWEESKLTVNAIANVHECAVSP